MRNFLTLMLFASILVGCTKGYDFDDQRKEAISENVQKVFGVEFDKNHDWQSATNGEVVIAAGEDTKTVQVLALVAETDDEGEVVTSMRVLNEENVNGAGEIRLVYDAPKNNMGLYVAFISESKYTLKKITGSNAVSQARTMTRASVTRTWDVADYTLPTGEFKIGIVEDSYASERGWIPGEKLYQLSDYESQKMVAEDYDSEYKELFRNMVFSYFKNGRKYNNLPLVKSSGYYNDKVYPITTGDEPIIVSPVYKNDGGYQEVVSSDLYYYYFKESDLGSDPVGYIESLPKYKAIQFDQCIKADDEICKHAAYALMYWGDGVPDENTVGSYQFPRGYKIGFMVRAKTDLEAGKKKGELYGDGRLNNYINTYKPCNFKSSNLGTDGPRAAWLTLNDKLLLCWESGTDADFNDIILEIEGGLEGIIVIPDPEYNVYTYCFEDTQLGDYDLNDVVIKAIKKNATTVEYQICACGAHDALFIKNINSELDNTEVHSLFGSTPGNFINTVPGQKYYEPVVITKTVDKSFSFLNPDDQPYIYDQSNNNVVKLSTIGENPHGIMIPNDFLYPVEKTKVSLAYLEFNNWGQSQITSTDWFTKPVYDRVYQRQ